VEIGGEDVRRVETFACEVAPIDLFKHMRVDLALPEYGYVLTLGVVLQAGKVNKRLFPNAITRRLDGFNKVTAATNLYDLARCEQKLAFPACPDFEADIDLPIIYSSIPTQPPLIWTSGVSR
jgi:hypothetical protein